MIFLIYLDLLILLFAVGATIRGRRNRTIELMTRRQTAKRRVRRKGLGWNPIQRFIRQAEMANFKVTTREIVIFFVLIPLIIIILLFSIHYSLAYSVILLVVYSFVPSWYMRMRVNNYHRRFRKELKDDIHLGTSVLRIGDTLESAFEEIAEHGSGRVTRRVFSDILHDHTVLQQPLMNVLEDYTERLQITEFTTFFLLTKVGLSTGGNLYYVWDRLSDELERLFAFESSANAKGISMSMMSYAFFVIQLVLLFFVMPSLVKDIPMVAKIIVYVLYGISFGAFFGIRKMSKTRV